MWSRITRSISQSVQFITYASHIFQKILISYTITVFRKVICDTLSVLYDYLLCLGITIASYLLKLDLSQTGFRFISAKILGKYVFVGMNFWRRATSFIAHLLLLSLTEFYGRDFASLVTLKY